MSSRPRNRGLPGRDAGKDSDVETELLARIVEGLKQAQKLNDESRRVGAEIMALEEEIKASEHSTPEQYRRLDDLYRTQMRLADSEKKMVEEQDIATNIAILKTLQTPDEPPAPRNGSAKARKGGQRPHQVPAPAVPIVELDTAVESPGGSHSPNEARNELVKRVKGTAGSQRSSSVASSTRATTTKEELAAESKQAGLSSSGSNANAGAGSNASNSTTTGAGAGTASTSATPALGVGVEVFYKFPKGSKENDGEGIHGIIKRVLQDKKAGVQYEVQDPDTDPAGKQTVRRATARELVAIPTNTTNLPIFPPKARVYAKYPETDTFYNAQVLLFSKGEYTLIFEGEEDNRQLTVPKRFVLDTAR